MKDKENRETHESWKKQSKGVCKIGRRRKYNANPAIYSKYKAKIGKNLNFYWKTFIFQSYKSE